MLNKFKGEIRIKNSKYEKTKGKKNKVIIIALFLVLIVGLLGPIGFGEKMMKIMYSKKYENLVVIYSEKYQVDSDLIFALIKAESNFEPNAESHRGAKGLMQLMYSTAEDISKRIGIELNEDNILEPDININLGTKYISMLIQKYNNINLALAAYNAGSGNVDGWIEKGTLKSDGSDIENVPFTETNNYVRKILRDYEIYKNIYEESN